MRANMMRCCWWLALLFGWSAQGATLNVTAEYNPATYEAEGAKFINTTPCNQFPASAGNGFFCSTTATVDKPQAVRFDANIKRKVKESDDSREGLFYVGFPGARDVTLVKQGGGVSYNLKFIVTAVGSQMGLGPVHIGGGIPEKGDCLFSTTWSGGPFYFLYRDVKEYSSASGGQCHGQHEGAVGQDLTISSIYLGYKLKAPNPLAMENGTYTGKLTLSMGRNQDFDFGAGTYTDTQLTVNFTIKVRHQIKVDFPPGGEKVVLSPPEGWSDWIYRGRNRVPSSLQAELHFRIWFSSKIKITLRCEYPNGEECFIKNTKDGHLAPIHVYWRNNAALITTTSSNIYIVPSMNGSPAVNDDRFFSFKITESQTLEEMMARPGGTYKGKVTIIFDATI